MSRIGRKPVPVPDKVKIESRDGRVFVTGPLGNLEQTLPSGVTVRLEGNQALVAPPPQKNRSNRGYQGLTRALLANMVHGVTQGYEKALEISGVGYRAEHKGETVTFTLGYTHPIHLKVPQGIKVDIDKTGTQVKVSGIDRQMVGQIAATIRGYKVPDPYKAKGVKYKGEQIRRKVGKTGAK